MSLSDFNEKQLIKKTYAATLEPERLSEFEDFWEAFIDNKVISPEGDKIDDTIIHSHFSMALGIIDRMRQDHDAEDYLQRLIDSHYGIGFIVDKSGNIILSNADARLFTQSKKSLYELGFDQDGLSQLLKWLNTQSSERAANPYAFKSVQLNNTDEPTCLFLAPVIAPFLSQDTHTQFFLITCVDFKVTESAIPSICDMFSLSPAEGEIAMHLSNGTSVKSIAARRGTTLYTVRSQVKQLLSKSESRDIPDLVRKISSLSSRYNAVTQQSYRFAQENLGDSSTRYFNLIMPDGRFMEFIEQGHPHGIPILQVHSVTSSVKLTNDAIRQAVLGGWRFITLTRAGYGNSSPNPQPTAEATVDAAVGDYIFLLDHLNIQDILILSGWAGCFSQRLAIRHPDRVRGIVQTGSVPVWERSHLQYMKPRHRIILKTSMYAPAAAPYMLRVAKALIDSGKARHFVEDIEKDSDVDISALKRDPHLFDVITEGHKLNLKQGTEAFIGDLKIIHKDWLKDTEKLTVPIIVLRGSENNDKPDSAYRKYKDAAPHADIRIIDGAGVYLYLTHFSSVLRAFTDLNTAKRPLRHLRLKAVR